MWCSVWMTKAIAIYFSPIFSKMVLRLWYPYGLYTIYRYSFAIYLAGSVTSHANAYMFTFTIFKYIIQVQFGNSICRSWAHEALVIWSNWNGINPLRAWKIYNFEMYVWFVRMLLFTASSQPILWLLQKWPDMPNEITRIKYLLKRMRKEIGYTLYVIWLKIK